VCLLDASEVQRRLARVTNGLIAGLEGDRIELPTLACAEGQCLGVDLLHRVLCARERWTGPRGRNHVHAWTFLQYAGPRRAARQSDQNERNHGATLCVLHVI